MSSRRDEEIPGGMWQRYSQNCRRDYKKTGVPFKAKTVEGEPATEIMKTSEDAYMSLIVIGPVRANRNNHSIILHFTLCTITVQFVS